MRALIVGFILLCASQVWAGPEWLLMTGPVDGSYFSTTLEGWTNSGGANFVPGIIGGVVGRCAAADIGVGSDFNLSKTVTTGSGNITFWVKNSLGSSRTFTFTVDSSPTSVTTTGSWVQRTIAVSAGTHSLSLTSGAGSSYTVYLDEMSFP
jgi:hypothetical protein